MKTWLTGDYGIWSLAALDSDGDGGGGGSSGSSGSSATGSGSGTSATGTSSASSPDMGAGFSAADTTASLGSDPFGGGPSSNSGGSSGGASGAGSSGSSGSSSGTSASGPSASGVSGASASSAASAPSGTTSSGAGATSSPSASAGFDASDATSSLSNDAFSDVSVTGSRGLGVGMSRGTGAVDAATGQQAGFDAAAGAGLSSAMSAADVGRGLDPNAAFGNVSVTQGNPSVPSAPSVAANATAATASETQGRLSGYNPDGFAAAAIDQALSTIRGAEAQAVDPYNGVVSARGLPSHVGLTDMTIAEVQDFQRGMIAQGYPSTAVGAYQTIAGTLAEQAARMGLDPETTTFSPAVQDAIAIGLMEQRAEQATRSGVVDPTSFANALAREWAGLANSTGQSHYAGLNGNRANVDFGTVHGMAQGMVDTGAIGGVAFADHPAPPSRPGPETAIAANEAPSRNAPAVSRDPFSGTTFSSNTMTNPDTGVTASSSEP